MYGLLTLRTIGWLVGPSGGRPASASDRRGRAGPCPFPLAPVEPERERWNGTAPIELVPKDDGEACLLLVLMVSLRPRLRPIVALLMLA